MLCLLDRGTFVVVELSTNQNLSGTNSFRNGLSCEGAAGPLGLYQRQKLFLSFRHCLALSRATSTLYCLASCFTRLLYCCRMARCSASHSGSPFSALNCCCSLLHSLSCHRLCRLYTLAGSALG
jgi:hypothetical protein